MSLIILCTSLVVATVVWGVRATYAPGMYYSLAGVQFTVICFAAWRFGARAITGKAEERRKLATAGGLLIMPFALVSFLPGGGAPGVGQTATEEQHRYLVLLVSAIMMSGGWVFLTQALSEVGERFYSTLGFAATITATPLYILFIGILLGAHRTTQPANPGEWPSGFASLLELADIFLFFGGILVYFATATFAVSLAQVHWLGRRAARVIVAMSVVALLVLVLRGMTFPDPNVSFLHWHTTLGWIAGIPAVPWMMPCLLGVLLLRRAGREERS